MSLIPATDDFNVDFKTGQRQERPLPPPGHDYDGQPHDDGSDLYPADPQVTTITLLTSTAEGDVTTLTVTPILTATGSPWADNLVPYVFQFTTAANPDDTLAKVAEGLAAVAAAAQSVMTLEDIANYQRVADFMSIEAAGDDLVITTRDAGATFSAEITTTGAITSTQVTTGTNTDLLRVGIFVSQRTIAADGKGTLGPAVSGEALLGLAMYSIKVRPRDAGDLFDSYVRSKDVVFRKYGTATALAEKGVTVKADVYRRETAPGDEVVGAVTDVPTTVQQVKVGTPTVANDTLYRLQFSITNLWTGAIKATGVASYTSDASALASEIVDNMITNIGTQAAAVDALVGLANVADTLAITANAGCVVSVLDLDANFPFGADAPAASSEHALVPGAKFLQTTTAASASAPIFLPHP